MSYYIMVGLYKYTNHLYARSEYIGTLNYNDLQPMKAFPNANLVGPRFDSWSNDAQIHMRSIGEMDIISYQSLINKVMRTYSHFEW